MNATLEINSDIKAQLHRLAEETHRSETELANEALSVFIAHDRYIRAKIQRGMVQAQHGEFVLDSEMDTFFAQHADKAA
ncbi:MAG TPA: CopG family transcriptional regulator [Gallionella sp.]|nr:CopG family transcriptional regulator [Gallionella sp.]